MNIRLRSKRILGIPLVKCDEDFAFIVNDQEYKTNKITALLLSPKIQKNCLCDPCYNKIAINTNEKGNFQNILDLANFHTINIPEIEISFALEVIHQLDNKFICILEENKKITSDNIFKKVRIHEKYPEIYKDKLQAEINFIASNFHKLFESQPDEVKNLIIDILEEVMKSPKLKLKKEDQILTMVNDLYLNDRSYSILYEHVIFANVSSEKMKEFSEIFDMNDLTNQLWLNLLERMIQSEPKVEFSSKYNHRYTEVVKITPQIENMQCANSKEVIEKQYTMKEILENYERNRINNKKDHESDESESESSYDCIW